MELLIRERRAGFQACCFNPFQGLHETSFALTGEGPTESGRKLLRASS